MVISKVMMTQTYHVSTMSDDKNFYRAPKGTT